MSIGLHYKVIVTIACVGMPIHDVMSVRENFMSMWSAQYAVRTHVRTCIRMHYGYAGNIKINGGIVIPKQSKIYNMCVRTYVYDI